MHDKLNSTRCFVAGKVGLGWGYDHAKPDVEGTNVRPKNFRSVSIRLPAIYKNCDRQDIKNGRYLLVYTCPLGQVSCPP